MKAVADMVIVLGAIFVFLCARIIYRFFAKIRRKEYVFKPIREHVIPPEPVAPIEFHTHNTINVIVIKEKE